MGSSGWTGESLVLGFFPPTTPQTSAPLDRFSGLLILGAVQTLLPFPAAGLGWGPVLHQQIGLKVLAWAQLGVRGLLGGVDTLP